MWKSKPFSVIIPVYNVEEYLAECLDSLLTQEIPLEVIIINDGSSDNSGKIIEKYQSGFETIQIINQNNAGLSAARNKGIEVATGEYLVFLDSDDYLEPNILPQIYRDASSKNVDLLVGNILISDPEGQEEKTILPFPEITGKVISGEECFITLLARGIYFPMAYKYIYRRKWIQKNNFRFTSLIHEDELWTPIVMCAARKVIITNYFFYHYRQREGSIMSNSQREERVKALFRITDILFDFAQKYPYEKRIDSIKGWLFVLIFRLYSNAFSLLSKIRHSDFTLPGHHLYHIFHFYRRISSIPANQCLTHYIKARKGLRTFLLWRLSPFFTDHVSSIRDRKLIVIYNTLWNQNLFLPKRKLPEKLVLTTNHKFISQADAVVFHLPDLMNYWEDNLEKKAEQIWVGWNMECELNHPWITDPDIAEWFDLKMDYHPVSDIPCPYYQYAYLQKFPKSPPLIHRQKDICMLISSSFNQSRRMDYLQELMKHIPVDSYGQLFNNKTLKNDQGEKSRFQLYKKYKFVIAFENAITDDYVTEKFYTPLRAGAVPIYLGAPNIESFAPGKDCHINVNNFKDPSALASFLKECLSDERKYDHFQQWRKKPLKKDFIEKANAIKANPFIRLFHLLQSNTK